MKELTQVDLHNVLRHTPKDVRNMMLDDPSIFMAGGFIRAMIAGEHPADIDLWGQSVPRLQMQATTIAVARMGKLHKTKNAFTVLANGKTPLQFITRWMYEDPQQLIGSFDFSICNAVIYVDQAKHFRSHCHPNFYPDLAAKRLVYLNPKRNEDAGGSMMRVLKYLKRGYHINPESLGRVIARMLTGIKTDEEGALRRADESDEQWNARIITSLLREVDPLLVIDGLELVDEEDNKPEADEVQAQDKVNGS